MSAKKRHTADEEKATDRRTNHLTEREIAILATAEQHSEKYSQLEEASSIAPGLRQLVDPKDYRVSGPPTREEVFILAAEMRDFADFLEERVAPLAQENDDEN